MSRHRQYESAIGARMRVNGEDVNYFCGTSYYTLHGHPSVQAAACDAIRSFGMGPGTKAGMPVYDQLIRRARAYFDAEDILYFASGYLSISVLLQGLRDDFDIVFVDAASHFCIDDALRSLDCPVVQFAHCDPRDLADQMAAHLGPDQRAAIVTDGVFPSTGALAPLNKYADLMRNHPAAILCIDDSHGVGVLGPNGRGSFDHFGLRGPQFKLAATFSKAFGGYGGFVAADSDLVQKIQQRLGLMAGASLPPVPAAAAASEGLRLLGQNSDLRDALQKNVSYLRQALRDIGLDTGDSPVPIICLRADTDLSRLSDALEATGNMVRYVPPNGYSDAPSVETVRIAVFSTHTRAQIDGLVTNLKELM